MHRTNEPLLHTKKLGRCDLLYGSKSPAEKVAMNRHAVWIPQSMGCLSSVGFTA